MVFINVATIAAHKRAAIDKKKREKLEIELGVRKSQSQIQAEAEAQKNRPPDGTLMAFLYDFTEFLGNKWIASIMYIVFIWAFQTLLGYSRDYMEFWLTNQVNAVFVDNEFDSHHHALADIRRVHDLWEWGYQVLVPGVFSNTPSVYSDQETWSDSIFARADGPGPSYLRPEMTTQDVPGVYNLADHLTPIISMEGSTPFTSSELREQMNSLDLTKGIMLRQVRVSSQANIDGGGICPGNTRCMPSVRFPDVNEDTKSFGHRSHTELFRKMAQDDPNFILYPSFEQKVNTSAFRYWNSVDLGTSDNGGQISASLISTRLYPRSGYTALILPFFSKTLLPHEYGTKDEIKSIIEHSVRLEHTDESYYYCLRTSINGVDFEQQCDPGQPSCSDEQKKTGNCPVTQVIYHQVNRLLDQLRGGHWIDFQTRMVVAQLQVSNPNGGMSLLCNCIFEFPAEGGLLPSTNLLSMTQDPETLRGLSLWTNVVLCMMIWFIMIEFLELRKEGPKEYLSSLWNWLDWLNFILFFVTYYNMTRCFELLNGDKDNMSTFYSDTGFRDDSARFLAYKVSKQTIAVNATLQLLKIVQFTNQLVPKMSLLTMVLSQCAMDLLFFGVIFFLSLFAFSNMFYVLLGTNIPAYYSLTSSVLSLVRALFGDFDVDEIEENSPDHTNAILFLVYLFVAVFILLSMFLAILADAQSTVTTNEDWEKIEETSLTDSLKKDFRSARDSLMKCLPEAMRTKFSYKEQKDEKQKEETIQEEPQSEFERQLRDLDDNDKLNQVELVDKKFDPLYETQDKLWQKLKYISDALPGYTLRVSENGKDSVYVQTRAAISGQLEDPWQPKTLAS